MNDLLLAGWQTGLIALAAAVVITAVIIIVAKILAVKRVSYSVKENFLTLIERDYFTVLKQIAGEEFLVFPQINLATVINKETKGYRSELFRNADFGFFTRDFRPVLLVEINDPSHERPDRIERDKSVNKICKKAGLPLVTFRTRDGIDVTSMQKAIYKHLHRSRFIR